MSISELQFQSYNFSHWQLKSLYITGIAIQNPWSEAETSPMKTTSTEEILTYELTEIARRTYDRRLTAGAGGNISALLDNSHFLISRSGSSFGSLVPEDTLKVALNGEVISGQGKPSSETPVHAEIYRQIHPRAVLHTHPPLICALALTGTPLTPLIFEHYVVLGDVPVIP